MARGDISGAALNAAYRNALRAFSLGAQTIAVDIVKMGVQYQAQQGLKEAVVPAYTTSMKKIMGSSLRESFKDADERVQNALLKATQATFRATVGGTEAEQRDNKDIKRLMKVFARNVNQEILRTYQEEFSGRSYRTGADEKRRSGGIERFLKRNKIAKATGHELTVSLAAAVNDDDVPHIFRLNYGTESLKGGAKAGYRAPNFKISMVPGSSTYSTRLEGERRPGFYYPGGAFFYRLMLGSAGQVQLYRASNSTSGKRIGGGREPQPSQGIAPNYFVEYGFTEAAKVFPQEMQAIIRNWKRRVHKISGDVSKLR
jgi:hypothetical protein